MKELLVGIDGSQSHYDFAVVAPNGALLTQFRIAKTAAQILWFAPKIDQFGVPAANCRIGLETAHNILIDFLWTRQYAVYIIPPSIVKSSRGRFGNRAFYTDAKDAHLIANLLRTDRDRFAPWRPDSQQLTKMKTKLGWVANGKTSAACSALGEASNTARRAPEQMAFMSFLPRVR